MDEIEDLNLWWAAWNSWYRIGSESTRPPITCDKLTFIPSQPFLTALIQIFPALYQHIKTGFSMDDLQKLGVILHGAVSVPISSDASPFILPSYTEAVLTSLQEAVLTALDVLQKVIMWLQMCGERWTVLCLNSSQNYSVGLKTERLKVWPWLVLSAGWQSLVTLSLIYARKLLAAVATWAHCWHVQTCKGSLRYLSLCNLHIIPPTSSIILSEEHWSP